MSAQDTDDTIRNRVAESALVTIDLDDLYTTGPRLTYDLAQHLYEGLILRERDLREQLAAADLQPYAGAHVAIACTADAIIPQWAFMLVAAALAPVAATVVMGSQEDLERALIQTRVAALDAGAWHNRPVIIRGCSRHPVHPSAYVLLTARLRPVARRIMYGEACSTVPVWKG